MFVRVVRFTDVSPEQMKQLLARIDASDGPPPGVDTTHLTVLYDAAQQSAVVLQHFASAQDMEAGAAVFNAMDAGDTPGTRGSIDMCAVALDLTP